MRMKNKNIFIIIIVILIVVGGEIWFMNAPNQNIKNNNLGASVATPITDPDLDTVANNNGPVGGACIGYDKNGKRCNGTTINDGTGKRCSCSGSFTGDSTGTLALPNTTTQNTSSSTAKIGTESTTSKTQITTKTQTTNTASSNTNALPTFSLQLAKKTGVSGGSDAEGVIYDEGGNQCGITWNEKLLIMGGRKDPNGSGASSSLSNEVYQTSDLKNWTKVNTTSQSKWDPRVFNHKNVVFYQGKIWVIGGYGNNSSFTDVWSSPDGANWTLVTSQTPFHSRSIQGTVVFKNKIWVIGQRENSPSYSSSLDDVWSSSDGKNWTQQASVYSSISFVSFDKASVLVFNDKLWIINDDGNKTLSSSDGKTWKVESKTLSMNSNVLLNDIISFNNKLWGIHDDVWSSSDAKSWTKEVSKSGINATTGGGDYGDLAIFKDKIVSVPAFNTVNTKPNVFSSSDAKGWTNETSSASFGYSYLHNLVDVKTGTSSHAPELNISKGVKTQTFSNKNFKTIGSWKLTGDAKAGNVNYSGTISIDKLGFSGSDISPYTFHLHKTPENSLDFVKSVVLTVYDSSGNVLTSKNVGTFTDPSYSDACGAPYECWYAIPHMVDLTNTLNITQGQTVRVVLTADVSLVPKNFQVALNGIGFVAGYNSCGSYNGDNFNDYSSTVKWDVVVPPAVISNSHKINGSSTGQPKAN